MLTVIFFTVSDPTSSIPETQALTRLDRRDARASGLVSTTSQASTRHLPEQGRATAPELTARATTIWRRWIFRAPPASTTTTSRTSSTAAAFSTPTSSFSAAGPQIPRSGPTATALALSPPTSRRPWSGWATLVPSPGLMGRSGRTAGGRTDPCRFGLILCWESGRVPFVIRFRRV